ncbi:hypothetical protein PIB30_061095, partial [Stylosanthes scabra]|nr:hypothetical protein [Stylosanthes scabra]
FITVGEKSVRSAQLTVQGLQGRVSDGDRVRVQSRLGHHQDFNGEIILAAGEMAPGENRYTLLAASAAVPGKKKDGCDTETLMHCRRR